MKICQKCKSEKILNDFNPHKKTSDGYETTCKECKSEIAKKYYGDNKEKVKEARRLTDETGAQYHVDHIVPLSKDSLHHEDNLQILTAEENMRKGAKYEENV